MGIKTGINLETVGHSKGAFVAFGLNEEGKTWSMGTLVEAGQVGSDL